MSNLTGKNKRECIFYQLTSNGKRCVLLSPEEWNIRRDKLKPYCTNSGKGCSILHNYMVKVGSWNKFMRKDKSGIM